MSSSSAASPSAKAIPHAKAVKPVSLFARLPVQVRRLLAATGILGSVTGAAGFVAAEYSYVGDRIVDTTVDLATGSLEAAADTSVGQAVRDGIEDAYTKAEALVDRASPDGQLVAGTLVGLAALSATGGAVRRGRNNVAARRDGRSNDRTQYSRIARNLTITTAIKTTPQTLAVPGLGLLKQDLSAIEVEVTNGTGMDLRGVVVDIEVVPQTAGRGYLPPNRLAKTIRVNFGDMKAGEVKPEVFSPWVEAGRVKKTRGEKVHDSLTEAVQRLVEHPGETADTTQYFVALSAQKVGFRAQLDDDRHMEVTGKQISIDGHGLGTGIGL